MATWTFPCPHMKTHLNQVVVCSLPNAPRTEEYLPCSFLFNVCLSIWSLWKTITPFFQYENDRFLESCVLFLSGSELGSQWETRVGRPSPAFTSWATWALLSLSDPLYQVSVTAVPTREFLWGLILANPLEQWSALSQHLGWPFSNVSRSKYLVGTWSLAV